VDQWNEHLPHKVVDTAMSLQYDQPSAQAPQSLLLAVPSQFSETPSDWSANDLFSTVRDTLDLAKVRLVDLDAFEDVGAVFPALFVPADPKRPDWTRDFPIRSLDEWLQVLAGNRGPIDLPR
jgi:hypothetical protein